MASVQLKPGQVAEVPLSLLIPDPDQPRKAFPAADLKLLVDSIKADGIVHPLIVRPGPKGKYTLIDGERRYRAAEKAGLKRVPALLRDQADNAAQLRITQAMVNTLRQDISPLDRARMFADLQAREKLSPKLIADRMSQRGMKVTKQQVEDSIRLLELPAWAKEYFDAGKLSAAAGAAILPAMAPHAKKAEILEHLRDALDDELGYTNEIDAKEVTRALGAAYYNVAVHLDQTGSFAGSKTVYFDWRKVCNGCEHLRRHGKDGYCLNREEFAKRNAEAKAAGLLPGGKVPKVEKAAGVEGAREDLPDVRQEARTASRRERIEEYFDGWLRAEVLAKIAHPNDLVGEQLAHRLAEYYAAGMPAGKARRFGDGEDTVELGIDNHANRVRLNHGRAVLSEDLTRQSLAAFLDGPPSWGETLTIAQACLTSLQPWDVRIVARWAEIDVPARCRVTLPYLELKRKSELLELSRVGGIEKPASKVVTLREDLLVAAEVIGMPPDLREIWERADDDQVVDLDDEDFDAEEDFSDDPDDELAA